MRVLPDKSFMYMNKKDRFTNPQFKEGLQYFFKYAALNPRGFNDGRIFCPCKKCGNRYPFQQEVVEEHVYLNGFEPAYRSWTYHGEGVPDETGDTGRNVVPVHLDLHPPVMDMAGGDASLSASWQVFHSKDDMPEEQLGTQRQHWESLAEADRQYRDAHPDYPATQSILPIDVKVNMLEHEFPNSASKGYVPLRDQGTPSRDRTSTSSSRSGYTYSRYAQEIHNLNEQLQQEREARINLERNTQQQFNTLMQQLQMPQNPQISSLFEAFQAWYASQSGGQGGSSGFGGVGGSCGSGGQGGLGGQ